MSKIQSERKLKKSSVVTVESRQFDVKSVIKKYYLLIIAVVVIIGILLMIAARHSQPPATIQGATTTDELPQTVGKLIRTHQYEQAQAAIQQAPNPTSQASQMLLAAVYVNNNQYTNALNTYLAVAKQYGLTASLAVVIAQTAVSANQPATARSYYQQAIALYQQQPNSPIIQQTVSQLRQALQGVAG